MIDDSIKIRFPDGSEKEFPAGIQVSAVLESLPQAVRKKALAAVFNDKVIDLTRNLTEDGSLTILTFEDEHGRDVYWHSSSHLLANAVKRLYPNAKLGIGPAVKDGFYYDFDVDPPFTELDLEKIEAEMKRIMQEKAQIVRKEMSRNDALAFCQKLDELYKVELISDIPEDQTISFYEQGDFIDLCRGPHLSSPSAIGHFKLTRVAGAYWKGNERLKMLSRVYGVSYPDEKRLNEHLVKIEEAKKRDHRKLGKQLELFAITDEVGPGMVLWLPRGAMIRHVIEDYWKKLHIRDGYDLVISPHIARLDLWKTSGHDDFYRENMFEPMEVDSGEYQLKPMNCPFHIAMFKNKMWSYRDLPLRWGELGTVYRYERSGVLNGLLRVRAFTQDDAHIFAMPEQVHQEVQNCLKLTFEIFKDFGFENYQIYLSTMPEKSVGEPHQWEFAQSALEDTLNKMGLPFSVDEGGGAFYGPKIDIKIVDALDRPWQCTTIQFDFNLPERFDLKYIGPDGLEHRPYIFHRALLGSMERFFALLVEHYSGAFPVWLSPEQAIILPISDKHHDYSEKLYQELKAKGLRVKVDYRNEKINRRIRDAEVFKIPYMLVIGDKEAESGTIAVRRHGHGDIGTLTVQEFMDLINDEIINKKLQDSKQEKG